MAVYEGFTIYGPYTRNDGRQHIVLTRHNTNGTIIERHTISYPKYIVEKHINRYLLPNETVDHIDCDFRNNELSNLRIVDRKVHCKSHTSSKPVIIKQCVICGKTFTTTDNTRIICGSKRCAGECTHINGHNKGNSFIRNENSYISNRSLVQEIVSVEGANSGKPLVGNPEQEE